ncbi:MULTISPECIES: hypothetical protein [Pseudomonas]|jgi:hypothetical protein|uniref:Phage protein n=9 Tax=Gammaproteobacteria TaxID=1236 RepID=A0AAX3IGQ9_9PSED|nr:MULTISPECIES: hypothetical protein [Pseudomonas]MCO6692117.1 hypothetical protein [Pseudomonas shirazica]PNB60062.1 hypothetical protein C1X73_09520 [Pseudomonas sp. FW305-130]AFK69368.1 hypothetical protein YSA_04803 [Pseudomonas putida ND6]ANI06087.1 hypothetical protein A210_26635 [Pseudomonas putida SJTE-1]AYN18661.1 hypothetical protein CHR29_27260 [Pseudomonas monteilii]
MIYESDDWRKSLLRSARWLEKARVKECSEGRIYAKAEREIFVSFYTVRKLIETYKISESTKKIKLHLPYYPITSGKTVDYFNRHNIMENYETTKVYKELRDMTFVANQVIHSYVFEFATSEDGRIDGVFVASDKGRHQRLYYYSMTLMLSIFRSVGLDVVSEQHLVRDPETEQWKIR